MKILRMDNLDLKGKRVLIREDLNVPVKQGKVESDARIRASAPTIAAALRQGAAVMVMSHVMVQAAGGGPRRHTAFWTAPDQVLRQRTGRPPDGPSPC